MRAAPSIDTRGGRDPVLEGLARTLELLHACALEAGPLAPAIGHALAAPGKRLRSRLTLAFSLLKQGERECSSDAIKAAAAVELLHEGSLVHDDVCDGSLLRGPTSP